jgi:hypothetical protein
MLKNTYYPEAEVERLPAPGSLGLRLRFSFFGLATMASAFAPAAFAPAAGAALAAAAGCASASMAASAAAALAATLGGLVGMVKV